MQKISSELDISTLGNIIEKLSMQERLADTSCAGCGATIIMDRYKRFVKCQPQFCSVCEQSGIAEEFKNKNSEGDSYV